jgi:hypothetical protein
VEFRAQARAGDLSIREVTPTWRRDQLLHVDFELDGRRVDRLHVRANFWFWHSLIMGRLLMAKS